MKHFLLILILFTPTLAVLCQPNTGAWGSFIGIPVGIKADELIDPNWQAQTIIYGTSWGEFRGIKGNAFVNDDWYKGYILLGENKLAKDVMMNFNIYTNEIYFLSEDKEMVVSPTIPVMEFGILRSKEDSSTFWTFRRGYPAVNSNTSKTFYNVLVNDKISLLKHYEKSIMDATNATGEHEKKFIDSESWYAYITFKHQMIELKKNENTLLQVLPEYSNTIQSIIKEKKLKLKSDASWIALITQLNAEIK